MWRLTPLNGSRVLHAGRVPLGTHSFSHFGARQLAVSRQGRVAEFVELSYGIGARCEL
jgi:hypothetical protein